MILQKLPIRLRQLIWQPNLPPFKRNEVLFQRRLREMLFQPFAEDHAEVFIHRDQAAIERGVMDARKA
jgi:hypothetical protein